MEMNTKFELTEDFIVNDFGIKLYKIKSLRDFGDVNVGDFGGYIERMDNLSQFGYAWVYGNAKVYGNAWVSGDVIASGEHN